MRIIIHKRPAFEFKGVILTPVIYDDFDCPIEVDTSLFTWSVKPVSAKEAGERSKGPTLSLRDETIPKEGCVVIVTHPICETVV